MTISKDDEREAREWLAMIIRSHSTYQREPDIARTILALLDRAVMPRPEELDDDDIKAVMARWEHHNDGGFTRTVYRALWDRYHQPPAPKKVEAWAVVSDDGRIGIYAEKPGNLAIGSRIVHLREVESEQ